MWIKRDIEDSFLAYAKERPALILTGGRQTGKTSLLRHLYPDVNYVSLDIPRLAEEAEESGESFLRRHETPIILDEIQYAPAVFNYLKADIDEHRAENSRYFITGSQKFSLMQGVTESLAGRAGIFDLYTLSAHELENYYKIEAGKEILLEWIFKGGYPELHSRDIDIERYYGDFVTTYLERDVRQALQVKNLRDYDRFLRLAAVRTGQLLSMNSFASDLGVSPNTVKSWLSVLEASGIIYLLEPYYNNMGKRIVKTPKLYFTDTGLAAYLSGFRSHFELGKSQLMGAFFETFVFGQILRKYANSCRRPDLYFFRDHYGNEVDFIIPSGQQLKLFECKWSENPKTDIRAFQVLEKAAGSENISVKSIITPLKGYRKKGGCVIEDCIDLKSIN